MLRPTANLKHDIKSLLSLLSTHKNKTEKFIKGKKIQIYNKVVKNVKLITPIILTSVIDLTQYTVRKTSIVNMNQIVNNPCSGY